MLQSTKIKFNINRSIHNIKLFYFLPGYNGKLGMRDYEISSEVKESFWRTTQLFERINKIFTSTKLFIYKYSECGNRFLILT